MPLNLVPSVRFPDLSYLSAICCHPKNSRRPRWEWVGKEMFGFRWLSTIVASFWASSVLVAYQQLPTFDVLKVPDMSNTPGIISSVGTCRSTWSSLWIFLIFHTYRLFLPYSFCCHPQNSRRPWWEWVGKGHVVWFSLAFDNCCQFLAHLWFLRGSRHLQYPWNNFSFGEMSLNMVLLDMFLTLHTSRLAYFFHIPFTVIQRTLEGPGGNEWAKEMFGFLWLSTIVASFSGSSVLVA